jgi:hypothetical protein
MSSILDNSYFYISIFSSACFVASEILPFLPNNSNGILHAVLLFLSSYNKNKQNNNVPEETKNYNEKDLSDEFEKLNIKIDKILNKFDIKTEKQD